MTAPAEHDMGARLFIHSHAATRSSRSRLAFSLRQMRRRDAAAPREPLCLSIEDRQGRTVLVVDDAGPLVDVPLPPGTYQVTARKGRLRRGYTLTLERGSSVDLHLSLESGA
ncbi:hypothetical protein ACFPOE_17895 [Caenimonas terrae]|uniref:Carboxypeptidase regulatory-like domain-containing protein n=1 Tax=Caenimonas terrae TaxID=696074 RepID=A0ABW0NIP0_9BURK